MAQWFLQHLGLEPLLTRSLHYLRWAEIRCQLPGWGVSGVSLYLVAVHDPARSGGAERLPPSLLQASADLGARPRQPFAMWCCRWQSRVLPLALSYLLTHTGRFYRPAAGWSSRIFIGNMVYSQQGAIGNMPMAAHSPWCRLFSSHCTWRS